MTEIRIEQVHTDIVKKFWEASPHATGFNNPSALARLSNTVDWWAAYRSKDLICLWPVCSAYGGKVCNPVFAYFLGPLFSAEVCVFKYYRYWAVVQQAMQAFIPFLIGRYRKVIAEMPVGFTDIQAFTWWGHDREPCEQFSVTVRHTARIDELTSLSIDQIRQNFRRDRRRDLAAIDDNPPRRAATWSFEEIVALHNAPIERQGRLVPPERIDALHRVLEVIENESGDAIVYRDPNSDEIASVMLLVYGKHDANNVLCVSSDNWRSRGLTAWTTWQGLLQAREKGFTVFDFNGCLLYTSDAADE